MKNKKHIAMRCNQEQFEAIKPKLERAGAKIFSITKFRKDHYLWLFEDFSVTNGTIIERGFLGEIHEEWNEKIFLEACGIKTIPTVEEVKEYFKDAETIKSVCNSSGTYFAKSVFLKNETYFSKSKNGFNLAIWTKEKGYAKILTYKTPKFEITKEQILLLMDKCKLGGVTEKRLKEWFPKAFESKLEVGEWYKSTTSKSFVLVEKIFGDEVFGYGFNCLGEFVNNDIDWIISIEKFIKATPEEVTEALKKESARRGFTHKIHIIDLKGDKQVLDTEYKTVFENGSFFHGGHEIMKSGIWATVIPTKTIQEAEELLKELGHEIKIVS